MHLETGDIAEFNSRADYVGNRYAAGSRVYVLRTVYEIYEYAKRYPIHERHGLKGSFLLPGSSLALMGKNGSLEGGEVEPRNDAPARAVALGKRRPEQPAAPISPVQIAASLFLPICRLSAG